MEVYRVTNDAYPVTRPEFYDAQLGFSLEAYDFVVYCAKSGSTPQYALVVLSKGGSKYAYTPTQGRTDYTGPFDSSDVICGRVGVASPTYSGWLKTKAAGWSTWVVR